MTFHFKERRNLQ